MSAPRTRAVSVHRTIPAPAAEIFDILASPAGHAAIDGSGTVVEAPAAGPARLQLGSRFGMSMKMGVPYRIHNEVVEFEENRRIAWQHFGKHRWRYELEPVEGGTLVTETFDWSTSRFPKGIELMGYPTKHVPAMERTLERLERVVTGG